MSKEKFSGSVGYMQSLIKAYRVSGRKLKMWLTPGLGVKRWVNLFIVCTLVGATGFLHFTWTGPWHTTATRLILFLNRFAAPPFLPVHTIGIVVMLLSIMGALGSIFMLNRTVLRGIGAEPEKAAEIIYERHTLARGHRVVALGGGTGLSNLLGGLKKYTSNITGVVTVADDGGSSGKLRQSLDMIAPGDLTDCYAALSDSPVLSRLLLHRFGRGEGLEGHTFGNLMLATLSEEQGGLGAAMQDIHEVLRIKGAVYPSTTQQPTLVAHLSDGREVRGESSFAAQVGSARIQRVSLEPQGLPSLPQVIDAIQEADVIVLGPGSLFTSIIPALLVPQIAQSIRESSAALIYVASIMTERGETTNFNLQDHVDAIEVHLMRKIDLILMNSTPPSSEVTQSYAKSGSSTIDLVGISPETLIKIKQAPMLRTGTAWHDSEALAAVLIESVGKLG